MQSRAQKLQQLQKIFSRTFHKFDRYGKDQRIFILYLIVLTFFMVFFPIIKVSSLGGLEGYSVWLLGASYFKTMLIVFVALGALIAWNTSFRFKNFVITYLGFKENDSLINFGLLWLITTIFFGITDTVSVISNATSRINVTGSAQFVQILLLVGLIFTLREVVKHAKHNGGKTKIINIIDEDGLKDSHNKRVFKGLFDEEDTHN